MKLESSHLELGPPPAHIWQLFAMWRQPRLAGGFFIAVAVLSAFRLVCFRFDPLPGEARFMPFFILGPLAAVLFGPAGVWAAPAASLLGGFLASPWSDIEWFRAGGEFAAAMHVFAFWDSSFVRRTSALALAPAWRQVVRFVALAVPAGLIGAAWSALGVELTGGGPFARAAALEAVQVLVFVVVLAPPLFRIAARDFAGTLGDWRAVAGQSGRLAHWRPAGLAAACISATITLPLGVLYTTDVSGRWPWAAAHPGGGLPELMAGLQAFHLLVILWPD